jgi:polyhydroxyalkanoate synthesis regulator phasin
MAAKPYYEDLLEQIDTSSSMLNQKYKEAINEANAKYEENKELLQDFYENNQFGEFDEQIKILES